MRTTTSFLDPATDAAILRIFELATPHDPMHFFGLKWLFNSSAPFIEPRDACYLQAMGIEKDANDETYGYLVLHSVELAECPPFQHSQAKVLRGKLYFSCLFRDVAPGILDVTLRGVFDTSGELRRLSMPYASLIPYATAAFVGGLLKALRCAEAKKLTLLARYNAVSGKNRDALNVDEENPKHDELELAASRAFDSSKVGSVVSLVKGKLVKTHASKLWIYVGAAMLWSREARQPTGMRPAEPE
ncbi:hypothetical protein PHPALM_2979 [Phytophthora palmivora]|uniref:Uncharacterized protein n=1 Tax=Phytophthora palmivora TaxID=4796 RepID=A0A2P4YNI1_9STRA|nr:hypothetical protein PHPALM_2979 [Phytophthora palmivora]